MFIKCYNVDDHFHIFLNILLHEGKYTHAFATTGIIRYSTRLSRRARKILAHETVVILSQFSSSTRMQRERWASNIQVCLTALQQNVSIIFVMTIQNKRISEPKVNLKIYMSVMTADSFFSSFQLLGYLILSSNTNTNPFKKENEKLIFFSKRCIIYCI